MNCYQPQSHPRLFDAWRESLIQMYKASVLEYDPDVTHNPLLDKLCGSDPLVQKTIHAQLARVSHPGIAGRLARLTSSVVHHSDSHDKDLQELRVWFYLIDTAVTVGAGLLFRTAALTVPKDSIDDAPIEKLNQAALLLDYHTRLSNDLSSLGNANGLDRDGKDSSCTILLPKDAMGAIRQEAVMRAIATCQRIAAWLKGELDQAVTDLWDVWPAMGHVFRRGMKTGQRIYDVGHFATLSRHQMSDLFDYLDDV